MQMSYARHQQSGVDFVLRDAPACYGTFAAKIMATVASATMMIVTLAPASGENFTAFGFTSNDVSQFEDYKRSINECGAAFIAEPDIFKPTVSLPL